MRDEVLLSLQLQYAAVWYTITNTTIAQQASPDTLCPRETSPSRLTNTDYQHQATRRRAESRR